MSDTTREPIGSIRICGGTLTSWRLRTIERDYYSPRGKRGDASTRYWLIFERGGRETKITSVEQIVRALLEHGCNLAEEAAREPAGLAGMFWALLDEGRLIDTPALWDFLEGKYHVPLAEHLPRVEDSHLRFTLAELRIELGSPRLVRVDVDLKSGAIVTSESAVTTNGPRDASVRDIP